MSERAHTPIPRRRLPWRLALGALSLTAVAALTACLPGMPAAKAAAAPATAEPPAVPVARVTPSALDHAPAQVARVEAAHRVDLRPRVGGQLAAVLFKEGDLVRAGQPLFQIDPRPFDAAVARARAELTLAQSGESLAASEAERARQLHAERAIAVEAYERRAAALAQAQAQRAAAEAALQAAALDRDFTLVRAPIAGRIGRALVTAGNHVAAGSDPTPLASLVSVSPLHVHFDVSDRTVLGQLAAAGGAPRGWKARILEAESGRELAQAPIDFADHSIESGTGTLRLRARVDAPDATLMPGQYVRVQLATGRPAPVLLVPDPAVGTEQGRRFVLVVGTDGKVEHRPVTVGASHEGRRIVTAGVAAGEQVIVAGLMRVRPGMTVRPQPADAAPAQAAASAANRS